jgi:hypothetical protein
MDADALGRRFIARQCPAPGAAPLSRDAIFDAVFDFYAEDRADGCDPSEGRDRLAFRWGSWGPGGALFGIELAREVLWIQAPVEWWVFVLTPQFLADDALPSCPRGILICGVPAELAEFRRQVLDSPAYRAAGQLKPAGSSLCYGPADVCRSARLPDWHPGLGE